MEANFFNGQNSHEMDYQQKKVRTDGLKLGFRATYAKFANIEFSTGLNINKNNLDTRTRALSWKYSPYIRCAIGLAR